MPAARLGAIDVVLLTHDHHADNLDDTGRALLPSAGQVITTVAGGRRLGTLGLAPWRTTQLTAPDRPTIEVTATPCRHGPPLSRPITGEVTGFALVRAHTVLPVHYEGWGHFSQNRPAVEAAFAAAPAPVRESLRWLTPGEATAVPV